jgi:hypothetical protein
MWEDILCFAVMAAIAAFYAVDFQGPSPIARVPGTLIDILECSDEYAVGRFETAPDNTSDLAPLNFTAVYQKEDYCSVDLGISNRFTVVYNRERGYLYHVERAAE